MSYTRRVPSANRKRMIKLRGYAYSRDALNFSRHRMNRSAIQVYGKYWRTSASRQAFNPSDDFKRQEPMDQGIMCTLKCILIQPERLKYWRNKMTKNVALCYRYLFRFLSSTSLDWQKRKEESEKKYKNAFNTYVILLLYTRVNIRIRIISILEL